ncbi:hypothetical protein HK103_004359 [Boothiomyces macroporosus]|uniref:Transcription elongation factor Eaf N-terminal domain-containing protein n=1 Tax=Boothiomyces macroporosus TaxID=261099 RepID=A0AAD5UGV3_9FUNG|nr:hypothetical protein HK103_004359 [Boothiomyces macroporosus]
MNGIESESHILQGVPATVKDVDCVLIFNPVEQCFTLEKVGSSFQFQKSNTRASRTRHVSPSLKPSSPKKLTSPSMKPVISTKARAQKKKSAAEPKKEREDILSTLHSPPPIQEQEDNQGDDDYGIEDILDDLEKDMESKQDSVILEEGMSSSDDEKEIISPPKIGSGPRSLFGVGEEPDESGSASGED